MTTRRDSVTDPDLVYSVDRRPETLDPATVAEVKAILDAAEGPLNARQILDAVCDARGVSRTRYDHNSYRHPRKPWPVSKVGGALETLVATERVEVYTGSRPDDHYGLPAQTGGRGVSVDTRWFLRTELADAARAAIAADGDRRGRERAALKSLTARIYSRFGVLGDSDDDRITISLSRRDAEELLAPADAEAAERATLALETDAGSRIVLTLFGLSERYRRIRGDTSDLLPPEQVAVAVMRAQGQYEGALEMAAAITGTRQDDLVAAVRAYRKAERTAAAAARDGLRRTATTGPEDV